MLQSGDRRAGQMNSTTSTTQGLMQEAVHRHQRGDLDGAARLCELILSIKPKDGTGLTLLGAITAQRGDLRRGLQLLDKALTVEPRNAEAHCNRGNILKEMGRLQAALESYDKAIALYPAFAYAYCNRGVVLEALNRFQAALESYDRALLIRPDFSLAYVNRANLLNYLGQAEEALADHDRALRLNPGDPGALVGQAEAYKSLGQLQAALASLDRAIALKPDHAQAHANRSTILLASGRFAEGWREYEWRWSGAKGQNLGQMRRHASRPLWLGHESLAGKSILLYSEQGLGDTLQFCRYAPLLHDSGAKVFLEVPQTLAALLSSLAGVAEVVPWDGTLPDFDFQCPLMSVPCAVGTTLNSIPASDRYLSADPVKVAHWDERLKPVGRPRIGLVWSGNQANRLGLQRSAPLAGLLEHLPGSHRYVSLQKEVPAEDASVVTGGVRLLDCRDGQRDLSDAAAICQCLDLLISVDTSIAHLGGALGVPTWILLPFNADWRWLQERDDSPWYPSVRLFRQQRPRDWSDVLRRVASEILRTFAN
jgi:tetratricopeptide (TPR) repeat protein